MSIKDWINETEWKRNIRLDKISQTWFDWGQTWLEALRLLWNSQALAANFSSLSRIALQLF